MPRIVKGPDGKLQSFPDDATDQEISRALEAIPEVNLPPQSAAKGWGDWVPRALESAVKTGVGLAKTAATATGIPGMIREGPIGAIKDQLGVARSIVQPQIDEYQKAQTASTPSEVIAHSAAAAIPVLGPMAAHAGESIAEGKVPELLGEAAILGATAALPKAAGMVSDVIPTTTKAGAKFKSVMGAAKDVPLDVNAPGEVALRIHQLAERGAALPLTVRKFLNWITDPEKPAMTYEVGRDFASNISKLSTNEFGRLTPAVAREVANLRVELNKANAQAAKQAGKHAEYISAMNEYARAMKLKGAMDSVIEGAKKTAPYATAVGAGYWLTKKVKDALGGND